jgi:hypothetical protein
MGFKALQWAAIVAILAALCLQWVQMSFAWQPGRWLDAVVGAALLFNLTVQVVALRRARRERKMAAR